MRLCYIKSVKCTGCCDAVLSYSASCTEDPRLYSAQKIPILFSVIKIIVWIHSINELANTFGCFLEVPGSNNGRSDVCLDWVVSWFISVLPFFLPCDFWEYTTPVFVPFIFHNHCHIRGCIQKFPDWPARTANGTALCH